MEAGNNLGPKVKKIEVMQFERSGEPVINRLQVPRLQRISVFARDGDIDKSCHVEIDVDEMHFGPLAQTLRALADRLDEASKP